MKEPDSPPGSATRDERDGYIVLLDPVAHFFRYCTAARARGLGVIALSSNAKICRAEEAGYAAMVEDYPPDAIDIFLTYRADDDESALAALAPYRQRIRGLLAGDEVTVASTARIARKLGLPYASPEDARCHQIKSLMKQRLAEHGVSTPRFAPVTSLEAAIEQWRRFGGDAMIKMVDYAMSFGIFRAKSRAEVEAAWEAIQRNRLALDHDFATEETVLVEEHVGGREFSVEGYVCGERVEILNFCEKLTHANFMVVGHYIPARVSDEEERLLCAIAGQCVASLGIRNSVFHAEVHIFEGRAYLIECAARPPGQYSVGVMKRIYDFDLMELNIDLACGNSVDVRRRPPRSWNAILALYADRTGIVRRIEALDELRERPECYALKCAVKPGDAVIGLESFRDILGLALLEAPDFAALRNAYAWARESVRFHV